MDEALIQQLVALGAIPEEQALMLRQADQGAGMMQTPSAQGMNVGGTFKASSPVEHLSVALQRMLGGKMQKAALSQYQGTLGKQTAGRGVYADALLKMLNGGQQQPQAEIPYYLQNPGF